MKLAFEHWKTRKFALEFARHTRNDRYTLRCGRLGVSLFQTANGDAALTIERIAACYVAAMGGVLVGYYGLGSILF